MSKNIIVAIDAGKHTLKCLGRVIDGKENVKRINFLSKMHETDDITEESEGNSYKVVFENKIYILGDSGKKADYESDKEKDLHKLCAYTSITEFLEPNTKDNHIYMVLACPVDFIKSKELKDGYKKFIKSDGEININVDGDDYSFTIEDITIKSEGAGVIYNAPEKYSDKEVALIDLGGVNFTFAIYRNCVVDKDSRFARDFGGNKLNKITRDDLRAYRKGKEVTISQTAKALENGYLEILDKADEGSKEVITNAKKKYIEDVILEEIKMAGVDIDSLKPVFAGGTSELLRDIIETKLTHSEVVKEAQWNAVQGLYVVANNKYSNFAYVATSK